MIIFVLWNQNGNTFPSSPPPVPSDPRNDPFPRACHVRLSNGVTVSLKVNPWCTVFFLFCFFFHSLSNMIPRIK